MGLEAIESEAPLPPLQIPGTASLSYWGIERWSGFTFFEYSAFLRPAAFFTGNNLPLLSTKQGEGFVSSSIVPGTQQVPRPLSSKNLLPKRVKSDM